MSICIGCSYRDRGPGERKNVRRLTVGEQAPGKYGATCVSTEKMETLSLKLEKTSQDGCGY